MIKEGFEVAGAGEGSNLEGAGVANIPGVWAFVLGAVSYLEVMLLGKLSGSRFVRSESPIM